MKYYKYIKELLFIFCLIIAIASCCQTQEKRNSQIAETNTANKLKYDTSKTVIISFVKSGYFGFDNSYKPATLVQADIDFIDSLLIVCVTDYNSSFKNPNGGWRIDLVNRNYRKQLVVATNSNGQKEVWVNCFCDAGNDNLWKKEIMIVEDGGTCFFNFRINLATKRYYDFFVNGIA